MMVRKKKTNTNRALESINKTIRTKLKLNEDVIELPNDDYLNWTGKVIPTGFKEVDEALGVGGLPLGRLVELYGPESGGKSYLAIRMCKKAQDMIKNGELPEDSIIVYVDLECALDDKWLVKNGIDLEHGSFTIIKANYYAEQLFDIIEAIMNDEEAKVCLMVIDSIAGLVTKKEMENENEKEHYAPVARVLSGALKKLVSGVRKKDCAIILINQLREKVGVAFGNPEITPGGRALKFFCHLRVEVRKVGGKEGIIEDTMTKLPIGQRTKIKVVKNKVAPPNREGTFNLYSEEPDVLNELFEIGRKATIPGTKAKKYITSSKGILSYGDLKDEDEDSFKRALCKTGAAIELARDLAEHDLLGDFLTLEKIEQVVEEREKNEDEDIEDEFGDAQLNTDEDDGDGDTSE